MQQHTLFNPIYRPFMDSLGPRPGRFVRVNNPKRVKYGDKGIGQRRLVAINTSTATNWYQPNVKNYDRFFSLMFPDRKRWPRDTFEYVFSRKPYSRPLYFSSVTFLVGNGIHPDTVNYWWLARAGENRKEELKKILKSFKDPSRWYIDYKKHQIMKFPADFKPFNGLSYSARAMADLARYADRLAPIIEGSPRNRLTTRRQRGIAPDNALNRMLREANRLTRKQVRQGRQGTVNGSRSVSVRKHSRRPPGSSAITSSVSGPTTIRGPGMSRNRGLAPIPERVTRRRRVTGAGSNSSPSGMSASSVSISRRSPPVPEGLRSRYDRVRSRNVLARLRDPQFAGIPLPRGADYVAPSMSGSRSTSNRTRSIGSPGKTYGIPLPRARSTPSSRSSSTASMKYAGYKPLYRDRRFGPLSEFGTGRYLNNASLRRRSMALKEEMLSRARRRPNKLHLTAREWKNMSGVVVPWEGKAQMESVRRSNAAKRRRDSPSRRMKTPSPKKKSPTPSSSSSRSYGGGKYSSSSSSSGGSRKRSLPSPVRVVVDSPLRRGARIVPFTSPEVRANVQSRMGVNFDDGDYIEVVPNVVPRPRLKRSRRVYFGRTTRSRTYGSRVQPDRVVKRKYF